MEHQKILDLLNEASDSKFVTRKWNIVNDQWDANYDVRNKIIYNTEVLTLRMCPSVWNLKKKKKKAGKSSSIYWEFSVE